MLTHKKHTKFTGSKMDGNVDQNDIVLNVPEVAELLGCEESDVAEMLREVRDDVTTIEDL